MRAYFPRKQIKSRFKRLSNNRKKQVKQYARDEAERMHLSEDWRPELYAVLPHHFDMSYYPWPARFSI